ncbi:MAG TPA: hypothetical protein VLB89_10020 [Gaiellaceae bacterium]|nr:hypothetical protein [Gaiellaceae bacterium]
MSAGPQTTIVPLQARGARAVGGPVQMELLGTLVLVALVGWLAAACALVYAAPDVAAARAGEPGPVLAAHLVAVALLPAAVAGASFHVLPVMLRTELRRRRLWMLPPLLVGGLALAPGIAFDVPALTWAAAAAVAAGLALAVAELGRLVALAPHGRTLIASRAGVALALFHAVAALTLGMLVFGHGDAPAAGVSHDRWMLIHLNVAILGWLTLLIVAVGRTLAPMLARAPAAPSRLLPREELGLTAGLWTLAVGIALSARWLEVAGGAVVALSVASFVAVLAHAARTRRAELEAPLVHMLAGVAFLAQSAVLGLGVATGAFAPHRALVAYVVFLLLGWAAGVVLGHLGKLLSLSLWVWWPPGPRPKQHALYPRGVWLAEAAAFALGAEAVGLAALLGTATLARAGAASLCVAAALAAAGAAITWSRRPGWRAARRRRQPRKRAAA